MGTYLKKSFSLFGGLLRLNLSKSGLGLSIGMKGWRRGIRPDGSQYAHVGRFGIYARKELGNINDQQPRAQTVSPKFEELSVAEQQAALARGEYPGHKPLAGCHIGVKQIEQARKASELLSALRVYRKLRKGK